MAFVERVGEREREREGGGKYGSVATLYYRVSQLLKYFNDTLYDYTTTGQCRGSHVRKTTLLFFIFELSPLIPMFTSFLACNSVTDRNNLMILGKIIKLITAAVACRNFNSACFIL